MSLIILGKVSPKVFELVRVGLPTTLNVNTVIVFVDFADADYPIGTRFTYLFRRDDPTITEHVQGKLIAVTQQFAKPVPEISRGWKTICAVEFLPSIPSLIEALPEIDDWYDDYRDKICISSEEL